MDTLAPYRELLKTIFNEHQALEARSRPDGIDSHYVADDTSGEYLILHSGIDAQTRQSVYGIVFHVWFKDDKIWVARDNVLPSITGEMVERGVPPELFIAVPQRLTVPLPA